MANLYVWFEMTKQRREFVMELLDIKEITPRNESKKAHKEALRQQEELELYIDMLEWRKTSSPYYKLCDQFFNGGVSSKVDRAKLMPWHELVVFERGIRRLYIQNSYLERPGYWLVLQFRDTKAAHALRKWVIQQVPWNHIGKN